MKLSINKRPKGVAAAMLLPLFCFCLCLQLQELGVEAHVALTYPPARGYDLDFLDNARTKAPCGMPKGKFKSGDWALELKLENGKRQLLKVGLRKYILLQAGKIWPTFNGNKSQDSCSEVIATVTAYKRL